MNEEVVKREASEVIQKKREAWGNMGVAVHETEMKLSAMAAQALQDAGNAPKTIEDVPRAESALKELKRAQKQIEEARKGITSKFDDVASRLMKPEKALLEPIENLNRDIVLIKREFERLEKIKVAKVNEADAFRGAIRQYMADKDFLNRSKINEQCSKAFEWALNNGVTLEALPEYLGKVKGKLGVVDFHHDAPTPTLILLTFEEAQAITEETYRLNAHAYVSMYHTEIDKKFSDYEVAFHNKQDALTLAAKEKEQADAALKAKKDNEDTALKIQAAASPVLFEVPAVKALKRSFVVDMPETQENAFVLLRAFIANLQLTGKKVNVSKWFSFTPTQAATALAKCKNDDEGFNPEGINFKEVEKL